jgi:hypothetical protein
MFRSVYRWSQAVVAAIASHYPHPAREEVREMWTMLAEEMLREQLRQRYHQELAWAYAKVTIEPQDIVLRQNRMIAAEATKVHSDRQMRLVRLSVRLQNQKDVAAICRVHSTAPSVWQPEVIELRIGQDQAVTYWYPSQHYSQTAPAPDPPLSATSAGSRETPVVNFR